MKRVAVVSGELFSIRECAAKAKCSPKTIEREIRAGKITTTRIRGLIRVAAEDWEDYKRRCRMAPFPATAAWDFGSGSLGVGLAARLGLLKGKRRREQS
jgi:hypothetical protein